MSFSSEALKIDSERFLLVKITPKKRLTGWVSLGGGVYSLDIGNQYQGLHKIEINGVPISFNRNVNIIAFTTGVDVTSLSNHVIGFVDFYFTGTTVRVTSGVSGIDNAQWEPLISSYPKFTQSFKNTLTGVFSLSMSPLSIINENNWCQTFMAEDGSFYRAEVRVWMCINSLENNRVVFDGEIVSASLSNKIVTLDVIDVFNKLNQEASFDAGSRDNSHYYYGGGVILFPNGEFENKPIPVSFGVTSPMEVASGWRHLDAYGNPPGGYFHLTKAIKCAKYYPANPNGTATISFSAGRVYSGEINKIVLGSIANAYQFYVTRNIVADPDSPIDPFPIVERIVFLQTETVFCEIGDYIPELQGNICSINDGLPAPYNVAVACPLYGQTEPGIDSTGPITPPTIANNIHPSMGVWIDQGEDVEYSHVYIPLGLIPNYVFRRHGRRYVPFSYLVQGAHTVGGYVYRHVTFTIDPVAAKLTNENGFNSLQTANVYCRFSGSGNHGHAEVLKAVVQAAGLEVDTASFAQAQSDFDRQVVLTCGLNDKFETYLELAEKICRSTLGTLSINQERKVVYQLIKSLSAETPDSYRSNEDLISREFSSKVEYQDVASSVRFQNSQFKPLRTNRTSFTEADPDKYVEVNTSKFLHSTQSIKDYEHCMAAYTSDRLADVARYASSPSVEYRTVTSSKDLSTNLGDIIDITHESIANESGNVKTLVTSINSSTGITEVKTTEIRGMD